MSVIDVIFTVAKWVCLKTLKQSYNLNLKHIYQDMCINHCFNNIGLYSQDSQDLLQVVLISLSSVFSDFSEKIEIDGSLKSCLDCIKSRSEIALSDAFKSLNAYIKSLKKQSYNSHLYIDSLDEILDNMPEQVFEACDFSVEGRYLDLTKKTHEYINNLDCLTKTEKKVCIFWVDGYSVSQTAKKMGISEKTVEKHRTGIKKSLVYLTR